MIRLQVSHFHSSVLSKTQALVPRRHTIKRENESFKDGKQKRIDSERLGKTNYV